MSETETEHTPIAEAAAEAVDIAIADHVAVAAAAEASQQAQHAEAVAESAIPAAEAVAAEVVAPVAETAQEASETATAAAAGVLGLSEAASQRFAEQDSRIEELWEHVRGHNHAPSVPAEPTVEEVEVSDSGSSSEPERETPYERVSRHQSRHRFGH